MRRFRYRYLAFSAVALVVVLPAIVAPVVASVITADLFIVEEENPITEDVYVASTSGRVEGLIDGDLTIVTGNLTIEGTISGSVNALTSGTVRIEEGGVIEGSLRTASQRVVIDGTVQGDALVTAASMRIGDIGTVGSDVIFFGGSFDTTGTIGRDLRGRMLRANVNGAIGRDIDIAVELLTIGAEATVGGDVLYRSPNEASIAAGAEIAGEVVDLPAQSNFFFGLVLTLANIVTFLGFLLTGLLALWLFRATGEASVAAIEQNPFKSLLLGIGLVIAGPLVVVLLAGTLVGLPVAAILLFGMVVGLVVGPIPSVTVLGDLLLRRRGGLFGAFVLGALLWRGLIWGTSLIGIGFVGALLFLIAHVWGVGGWVLGGWRVRDARQRAREALPEGMLVEPDEVPEDFEYPLAPSGSAWVAARETLDSRAAAVMDDGEDEDGEAGG